MNSTEVAEILLSKGAVTLRPNDPFTYSSGLKGPIYTDNRVLISYPDVRSKISAALKEESKKFGQFDVVAGVATAGITWAAWLAEATDLPMIYVRDKAKSHGRENQIEGSVSEGAKVLVIEDLVTTGGSCLKAVEAIRQVGATPIGVAAIFTYGLQKSLDGFKDSNIQLEALTDLTTLAETAANQGLLDQKAKEAVLNWASNPAEWTPTNG
jgi:orotate phosphoribosyltransferase